LDVTRVWQTADPIKSPEQQDGHDQVYSGSREGDYRPLPALLAHYLVRGAGWALLARIDFREILASHPNVATQRQGTHAIVCIATLPAKKPWAKSDRENLNTHAKHPRGDEMSPFVDQNHHAKNEDYAE